MANGNVNGNGYLSLFMRAGKWGAAGLFLAALGSLAQFLFPNLRDIGDLKQFFAWSGMALGLIGLSAQAKRGTDMQVTVAAESKIDRALIINNVTPSTTNDVVATSTDLAVQNEIDKRMSGQHGTIA